jgi:CRISPR-associated endonuclease Cas1
VYCRATKAAKDALHANDVNYATIRNGIVAVSGNGPAIRVQDNRIVIRDGPKNVPPIVLTRAEARRRLRHVLICDKAGGYVTIEALRWFKDTGIAFSCVDWDASIVFSTGPRGTDFPALRRRQALAADDETGLAIVRELLHVKMYGQAEVVRMLGRNDAADLIARLTGELITCDDGVRMMTLEAAAALAYWECWAAIPVHFARSNPEHQPDPWAVFGPRASLLTGKAWRASSPGNAILNFLYAILETEMTVALYAVSLDPGLGIFHRDADRRSSLTFDAMEPVRPLVDCWLLTFLDTSRFLNRDFHEMSDGEVRLTRPLNSHLAMTAALWKPACEMVAAWIVTVLSGDKPAISDRQIHVSLPLRLTTASKTARAWLPALRRRAGIASDPAFPTCIECGRLLRHSRRKFCSGKCAMSFYEDTPYKANVAALTARRADPERERAAKLAQSGRASRNAADRALWRNRPEWSEEGDENLRRWFSSAAQPALKSVPIADIRQATGLSKSWAIAIRLGRRIPHPCHFAALARLAEVEPPAGLELPP